MPGLSILLVNHYAGSPRHGMEFRPWYLAHEWQALGHRVHVVAASASHVRSTAPTTTANRTSELVDGVPYTWFRTPGYRGNGFRRVLNMLAFVLQVFWASRWLGRTVAPDVVIASSTYPLDIFPAWYIARRSGARLVFEVHDLWPLSPIELGGVPRWHPYILLLSLAERFAYRRADHVVSMLPCAREYMQSRGMAPEKWLHIPNGVDPSEWESTAPLPAEAAELLANAHSGGRFVVGYAGAHGLANRLDLLLETANLLRHEPVSFVLVGSGPERAALVQRARRLDLHNTSFLDAIPKAAVPALLQEFDACFITLQAQPLFRFGISPNKLIDYMMAGRPVIQAIQAGNDPVAEAQCGISIPPEDPAAVAAAVRALMALAPAEREAMGARGRAYAIENHDYRALAARFLEGVTRG